MSSKNNDMEECLRKLMVPLRRRLESGAACDEMEVRALLARVLEHARITGDMRFVDCVTYYEELGITLKESQ